MAANSMAACSLAGSFLRKLEGKYNEGRSIGTKRVISLRSRAQNSDEDKNDALDLKISRRYAAILLPVTTALVATGTSPKVATADDQIQCTGSECGTVQLLTLNGCGLGVARYPDFVYNAGGGGGSGVAQELSDGRTLLQFDPLKLKIPPVNTSTTTLLGLPMPPGLKIEIVPKSLEGYLERRTGKVELNFLANFYFTIGPIYRAPPLVVNTVLTTETVQGAIRGGKGKRLDSTGECQLVGVAELARVDDSLLNSFLTLPTDCLAELKAKILFA
ncbi:hypothetical protein R1sor_024666 [Riccia sorocarpa]|uniref:Uncharacterized protein n=1 Tax=Riccia sorocarpa TaxID=122646 RepID=A0ABD3GUA8_9MARC